jgi:hypothetical protein
VDLLDQKFEWRRRDLVVRGWHFCMPGHRLILRPMSKPEGALPARYTHCFICACPCSACCGFCCLLWEEYWINLTWYLKAVRSTNAVQKLNSIGLHRGKPPRGSRGAFRRTRLPSRAQSPQRFWNRFKRELPCLFGEWRNASSPWKTEMFCFI